MRKKPSKKTVFVVSGVVLLGVKCISPVHTNARQVVASKTANSQVSIVSAHPLSFHH